MLSQLELGLELLVRIARLLELQAELLKVLKQIVVLDPRLVAPQKLGGERLVLVLVEGRILLRRFVLVFEPYVLRVPVFEIALEALELVLKDETPRIGRVLLDDTIVVRRALRQRRVDLEWAPEFLLVDVVELAPMMDRSSLMLSEMSESSLPSLYLTWWWSPLTISCRHKVVYALASQFGARQVLSTVGAE